MELLDILAQAHGGNGLAAIGRQFGLDEQQAAQVLEQLAPVIAAGLRRNMAQSPDQVVNVLEALERGNHERYLDDPEAVEFSNAAPEGNAILGHIFGSRDVSREVAMRAAGSTGIGAAILKKLLPVIATMVMGSLARKMMGGGRTAPRQGSGGAGDIFGDTPGGPAPGGRGLGDILGEILGGGPGSSRQRSRRQPGSYNEEALGRGRSELDDILGRGTRHGNAADDLLESVERHLNRL